MDGRIYEIIKKSGDLEEQIDKILSISHPLGSSEVVAYLLKRTMDMFGKDPLSHSRLLNGIPSSLITKFAPGLLSFYFCLLKDQKTRSRIREAATVSMKHVLESVSRLDDNSEGKIHEFFYFHKRPEFEDIYRVCAQKFKTRRRLFFISELLLLGHLLEDNDYDAVNDSIEEVFSPDLIRKLLDRGKYRNNEEIFNRLVWMYKRGEDVSDVISRIQERHNVKDGVAELFPVNKETTRNILQTNDLKRIERFFRDADHIPMHINVIGKYLELCESPKQVLECNISRRFEIQKMIIEDYDKFLEYAFNGLEDSPRILINLIGIEFRPKLEDFILQSMEFISRCNDAKRLCMYLYFMKIVVGKDCLRRSILRRIFDGLVYLDNEDYRIRCMKYEILGELFVQYALMDKAIENDAYSNAPHKEKDIECRCPVSEDILRRVDTKNIDEDNVNVLAAIIWNELAITPVEGELMAISILLRKIIDSTGMFYENRIAKSSFILHLVDMHGISRFNETKRRSTEEFLRLLGSMARFNLSKKFLKKMFLISLDYFHILDTSCLIRAIIKNDRYHCLFMLCNLSKSKEKILSKKLLEFLKKSLKEAQE
ncbi:hypothetical protein EROM_080570 [Encephalitozoon romaleae SJ-2008]|uniref:Uncharacterized protein n=1 Tax=Encephalitozoon romaleae (strain SJ-2008) TaxID=1178016 RepID=I7ASQ7_ENCRO|nr:hypothetical protein EROM_080570 [Encephalitozoon romaleae SJ-2008]AFN83477.1 hypothetical protein EROM_080570 [Encephalitozoon romaleae SJ-2008]